MNGLKIASLKQISEAMSNKVFVSPKLYQHLQNQYNSQDVYVKIKDYVFTLGKANHVNDDSIALSKKQRILLQVSETLDVINLQLFKIPIDEYRLSYIKFILDPRIQTRIEIEDEKLKEVFLQLYESQFLAPKQELYLEYKGIKMFARIEQVMLMETPIKKTSYPFGMLTSQTEFEFTSTLRDLKIKSKSNKLKAIFRPDFKFEDMGVGGLDSEIQNIFRRAFSTRRIPNHILEMYGINHVKGLLLHGPPGTGKTLIARQLAKVLHAKEPKIINGPELFNKFVGETEKNVRELFDDARKDEANLKEDSPLHIIIFDEFDAIAKPRGSTSGGTGVSDNVVNQLLSVIDGVETLNNILVIGMTNRKDLIDPAVLRPGRFEVHIEVGLPDEKGRQQILQIHTKVMQKSNLLAPDVNLEQIAKLTKNYTGAEIEAIVKSANSFALNRNHDLMNFTKNVVIDKPAPVEMQDFLQAVNEIRPEFGSEDTKMQAYLENDMFDYGKRFQQIMSDSSQIITEITNNEIPLASLLIYGQNGTGKTTIAANIAKQSNIPFVKFISSEELIGKSDYYKVNFIVKCFDDAYRSKQSIVILDDLERLVEYVEIGKRFSNSMLQAIMVLIKKLPEKSSHSIAIIATSSNKEFLKEFGLLDIFNIKINVPQLQADCQGFNEIGYILSKQLNTQIPKDMINNKNFSISIKKLIFVSNLMKKQDKGDLKKNFEESLRIIGQSLNKKIDFGDFNDRIDSLTNDYQIIFIMNYQIIFLNTIQKELILKIFLVYNLLIIQYQLLEYQRKNKLFRDLQ